MKLVLFLYTYFFHCESYDKYIIALQQIWEMSSLLIPVLIQEQRIAVARLQRAGLGQRRGAACEHSGLSPPFGKAVL